uniref:Serine protease HTRA2, mitochondrial n=1 Tax=Ixodes ricinus TaxID=34613 RepID=A0A131Y8D9_IXORI
MMNVNIARRVSSVCQRLRASRTLEECQMPASSRIFYRQHGNSSNYDRNSGGSGHQHKSGRFSTSWRSSLGTGLAVGALSLAGYTAWKRSNSCSLSQLLVPTLQAAQIIDSDKRQGVSPPSRNFNFIADAVEKTAPAVVFIEILGRHPFTQQQITVSNGSGFIVKSDGLILTNAHVVADGRLVTVKLQNGKEYKGKVESVDLRSDLATVRIVAENLPTLPLSRTKDLRPGEWVVAMGSPLALNNTITAGVISSLHRSSKELGIQNEMDYIQTDAAINFGNSGGPLINLDGKVIGINTMKVTSGISFAIPADYALDFLETSAKKLKEDPSSATSERWYLGITMLTLTPSLIQELQERDPMFPNVSSGVLVWRVVLGSPANLAGLQPGDVITRIGGKEARSSQDIYRALEAWKPVEIEVIHRGSKKTVTAQP